MGRRRPRRSEKRPDERVQQPSRAGPPRRTRPRSPSVPRPAASSRSGASTPSTPKSIAGRALSQSPPRKRASRERAPETAPDRCVSRGASAERPAQAASASATSARSRERALDPDDVRDRAEQRAEDRAEDREAERRPDQLAATGARRRHGQPCERAGPGRRARDSPARSVRAPSVHGEPESANAKLATASSRRPARTARRGPYRARCDPAGDPAERARRRRTRRPGARRRLREVELVRVPRDERDERAEQHRVDEDDRADEDEQAAACGRGYPEQPNQPRGELPGCPSGASSRAERTRASGSWFGETEPLADKNSPSRVRFRPPPRRTFGLRLRPTGVGSTYSRPVLGARRTLAAATALSSIPKGNARKMRETNVMHPHIRTTKNSPSRVRFRPDTPTDVPLPRTRRPGNLRPTRVPCSVQAAQ